jgi:hypothetical protein
MLGAEADPANATLLGAGVEGGVGVVVGGRVVRGLVVESGVVGAPARGEGVVLGVAGACALVGLALRIKRASSASHGILFNEPKSMLFIAKTRENR